MKKNERLNLRVTADDKARWEEAAAQSGKSLSAWLTYWANIGETLQKSLDKQGS